MSRRGPNRVHIDVATLQVTAFRELKSCTAVQDSSIVERNELAWAQCELDLALLEERRESLIGAVEAIEVNVCRAGCLHAAMIHTHRHHLTPEIELDHRPAGA